MRPATILKFKGAKQEIPFYIVVRAQNECTVLSVEIIALAGFPGRCAFNSFLLSPQAKVNSKLFRIYLDFPIYLVLILFIDKSHPSEGGRLALRARCLRVFGKDFFYDLTL